MATRKPKGAWETHCLAGPPYAQLGSHTPSWAPIRPAKTSSCGRGEDGLPHDTELTLGTQKLVRLLCAVPFGLEDIANAQLPPLVMEKKLRPGRGRSF